MAKPKKFLPHEQMMERFEKEGRVSRQELSLKQLVLDHRLQAREKPLDLDNVKELHGYVKDGQALAPIIVFRIDGKDYVTNGFHRSEVHRKEGLPSILADVVEGTWQEAIEFSACCNLANHALVPTKEDKKKAAYMLLDNGWLSKSASSVGRHVGVGCGTVLRWIASYCEEKKIDVPSERVSETGKNYKAQWNSGVAKGAKYGDASGRVRYKASIGGKSVHLSMDSEAASVMVEELIKAKKGHGRRVAPTLARFGMAYHVEKSGCIGRVQGGKVKSFALTAITYEKNSPQEVVGSIVSSIGRALVLAENFGCTRKSVIVHEPIEGYEDLIDIARRLGVEFMTLDQFVEAVKFNESEAGAAVAS